MADTCRQRSLAAAAAKEPSRPMKTEPLVSIVINNYNYGHFLRDAIDSALQQTYTFLEVIVVDDGSTDDSLAIIEAYGERIIPIFKENGGQASALNAGFAHSRGAIVIFLDADDCLSPKLVERIVFEYRKHPDVVHITYRLAVIDENDQVTGSTIPPAYLRLPSGTWSANRFSAVMNCASWAPTSGNAFLARVLQMIMPMPEALFRIGADYYLVRMSALFGPIGSLSEVGGYYRTHTDNAYHRSSIDLEHLRSQITFFHRAHQQIRMDASAHGFDTPAAEIVDEIFFAQRTVSCKLAPEQHPLVQDTLSTICKRGAMAALRRPDLAVIPKLFHVAWFLAMLILTRRLAEPVSQLLAPNGKASFIPFLKPRQLFQ